MEYAGGWVSLELSGGQNCGIVSERHGQASDGSGDDEQFDTSNGAGSEPAPSAPRGSSNRSASARAATVTDKRFPGAAQHAQRPGAAIASGQDKFGSQAQGSVFGQAGFS